MNKHDPIKNFENRLHKINHGDSSEDENNYRSESEDDNSEHSIDNRNALKHFMVDYKEKNDAYESKRLEKLRKELSPRDYKDYI